ncbi:MAG TPA: adenosine deaminase [Ktedonobacteraceae bacterium]|nr:adenosine deaminase [Ktedonobacteraceae bacterium]
MDYTALPKVELHLHLDCSLSYEAVARIDPSVTLREYQQSYNGPEKYSDLSEFFGRAPKGTALMQTEEQLRLVTGDVFKQLELDHVIYAEIVLVPTMHTGQGLTPDEVVEIVDDAVARESEASGIEARLILSTLRHYSPQQSMATVKQVERFMGRHVGGIDLGAYEAGYPIYAHIAAYQYAAQQGIPRTVHAGEARGPDSVWETLKHLRPSRIGHGVRSIEDPALVAHLRQERIHLEICPSSNIQIDLFEDYAHHPINVFYEEGLSIGVNTDTRMIANVTLAQEYEKLNRAFGWDERHFLRCNLDALAAAFAPDALKQPLEHRLRAGYEG